MANRRGTAAGDRHDEAADSVHVPGVYRTVLWKWCEEQVMNPNNGYPVNCYGTLEYEHEEYAAWDAEVGAVTDKLFEERVGSGAPVVAWWCWFPPNLPPPLDNLGKTGDGPRRFLATSDDRVEVPAAVSQPSIDPAARSGHRPTG
jgi:hypothetical protein